MGPSLSNIFRLGVKELHSVRRDAVMMGLIVYTFTFAVYVPSRHAQTELRDGSVAIVDADRSQLSARIGDALMAPHMQPAVPIDARRADAVLDSGEFTFVIEIPPGFQADAAAGRRPTAQVIIDATAITQAAQGAAYIRRVFEREAQSVVGRDAAQAAEPIAVVSRAKFNPNLQTQWFMGVMQFINVITILSIVLTGAALMRERGYGRIVNVCSNSIFAGTPNMAHYVASKGGVLTFTRALATELGAHKITANCVCPGLTDTEGVQLTPHKDAFEFVEMLQAIKGRGVPEDIVPAVAFLASEDASYVTGAAVAIDGGLTAATGQPNFNRLLAGE